MIMELWDFVIFNETVHAIGLSLLVFLLFLLFRKLFTKYVFSLLLRLGKKAPGDLLSSILLAFKKPVEWFFIIIGFYIAARYFPFFDHTNPLFLDIVRASIIVLITWALYNLASESSVFFSRLNNRYNIHVDDILIPFFSRALRFIILAISFSIIAQEFGYEISGFVAGLGLGGLAFSLAAQDALANLFGGVVIITEKPFTIGDWILTPSVEGTVEDITFRSTKVRTFADAIVTVPNATLAKEPITNWSKMGKRQITFNLHIEHLTPLEKLRRVVKRIETYIKQHEGVHPGTIFVKFNEFRESGYAIYFYFFTKTTNWGEYLDIREEINFKILEILDEEEIEMALAAHKLYVDQEVEEKEIRRFTSEE